MDRHAALSSYNKAGGSFNFGSINLMSDATHLMCLAASVAAQYSASAVDNVMQECSLLRQLMSALPTYSA